MGNKKTNLVSVVRAWNKEDQDREFRKSVGEAAKIARMYFQAERDRLEMIVPTEWSWVLAKTMKIYSN